MDISSRREADVSEVDKPNVHCVEVLGEEPQRVADRIQELFQDNITFSGINSRGSSNRTTVYNMAERR